MDDLRTFYWPDEVKIPIYGVKSVLDELTQRFHYLFTKSPFSPSYFMPSLETVEIEADTRMDFGGIDVKILKQIHGRITSLGFVFDEKVAYSTDLSEIPEYNFKHLMNLDVWVVEGLRETTHQAHAHFDLAFEWIDRCKPKKAYLTHLGLESDYDEVLALCPDGTEPGYDGLSFTVK
jgi:phosphoribosyl 1,2-cyclic phosphate phosphodiesterase